ncbi:MAG: acyl-CoA synthetase [Acidimicrobiales bacterium]|nr:acyl-CoA synthetase [Acidimicrobiales bacterium]
MTPPTPDGRRPSFWERAPLEPGRLAIVDPDGQEWTYGALWQAGNQVANGLRALGLAPQDPVAVILPNSHQVYEVFSAALQTGLYYVPINFHLTGREIEYILTDSGAKAMIGHARYAGTVAEAADSAGIPAERRLGIGGIEGFRDYDEFRAAFPAELPSDRSPGQRMYYTSGTTGRPKGVQKAFPSGQVDADAVGFSESLFGSTGLRSQVGGVHLVAGPTYHAAPLGFGLGALHLGQTVVLMDKWSPEGTLERIEKYKVTNTHMVPTMFNRLLKMAPEERGRYDLSSLDSIAHAAAPCPVETKRQMLEWLGPIISEYYASSEVGGTFIGPEEWMRKPGSVGRPRPGVELKILDETGEEQPTGTPGLVYFLIQQPFTYHNDPTKTAATRLGDFATVGDIGYLDEDGYLFLCDRDSNLVIVGGVNVYPAEAENELIDHPSVLDVAVIGVPNPDTGEELKAVVATTPGTQTGPELASELIAWCQSRLAKYKCPRSVDFVDALPRLDNGKLYKEKVRAWYWGEVGRNI